MRAAARVDAIHLRLKKKISQIRVHPRPSLNSSKEGSPDSEDMGWESPSTDPTGAWLRDSCNT